MATTWIKALHANKGKTIAQTLMERTDYAENPDKTENGNLVVGYGCDPHTAMEEFLLSKREYETTTGRDQGKRNILAYHIRQSFKPGEIEPQEALEIGYDLAHRFTKGKHQFIVAVHIDKAHVHCHIVFNSTTMDCKRKFKNFFGSSFALRRLSDIICAEHGLSIVENPKPSKGKNYGKWLGDKKPQSFTETIKRKIDEILPYCDTFEDFVAALRKADFTVKDNRKHISVCAPGQKKPIRLDTIGGEYSQEAIHQRIGSERIQGTGSGDAIFHTQKRTEETAKNKVGLLIDIQAKIREGKGGGYAQWAKVFNLKQAAKTLVFLQENGIDSYEDLSAKSSSASSEFAALTTKIKEVESRQKEVSELQKYIGQYSKTREVYARYKTSGWSRSFYDKHAAEIILHRAAKKHFDTLGLKNLPTIASLKQEWAKLAAEKKKLFSGYHALKEKSHTLSIAKGNADRMLGIAPNAQKRDISHEQKRHDTRRK